MDIGEYKKLLVDTLDTGWALDYHEAVDEFNSSYEKSLAEFSMGKYTLLEEYEKLGKGTVNKVYCELIIVENPYKYTNPRSYELRYDFADKGESFEGYFEKRKYCEENEVRFDYKSLDI